MGKKVYLVLKVSQRAYSGVVIQEDDNFITIKDCKGFIVQLNKESLAVLQEEKY